MPAAVAEGVKLLGIAKIETGLFAHPFAQARFQGALDGRDRTDRTATRLRRRHAPPPAPTGCSRSTETIAADRPMLIRSRALTYCHRPTSGKAVVTPSATISGGPIALSAAIMRPPRPSASSAWRTRSGWDWAWGARRRMRHGDLDFALRPQPVAQDGVGRRHGAADAGPAMDQQGLLARPSPGEKASSRSIWSRPGGSSPAAGSAMSLTPSFR